MGRVEAGRPNRLDRREVAENEPDCSILTPSLSSAGSASTASTDDSSIVSAPTSMFVGRELRV